MAYLTFHIQSHRIPIPNFNRNNKSLAVRNFPRFNWQFSLGCRLRLPWSSLKRSSRISSRLCPGILARICSTVPPISVLILVSAVWTSVVRSHGCEGLVAACVVLVDFFPLNLSSRPSREVPTGHLAQLSGESLKVVVI